mmetsp:Transcript_25849/g.38181  ORF Transcript_25849/g.38181 Transcript_25849/m.38181 type:complete len:168 (-) Transcript_25849:576-1079(-)|eukprot:CAMPEP_0195529144 /NCGR_PEP_ID=MMETSP0794_2-20130614/31584_1 /TAXON_ID=515487 /ORGANISM="Stephanopyxis turris, Strain CCMP 815" /LENGTH=167 /DNA_ID=CAMNT_0040660399 /DNA_START=41 /DNA_END=544 /DNA_ORIENTATION=-
MEEAARTWCLELNRAGTDLARASHRLNAAFRENSERGMVPEPHSILRRLSALEANLHILEAKSCQIAQKRVNLVRETSGILSRNVMAIQKLSTMAGNCEDLLAEDESHTNGRRAAGDWLQIAGQVSDQQHAYSLREINSTCDSGDKTEPCPPSPTAGIRMDTSDAIS